MHGCIPLLLVQNERMVLFKVGRHTEEFPFGYTQSLMQAIQSKDGILPWRFPEKCCLTEIWDSGGKEKKRKNLNEGVCTRCGQGMGIAGFPFFTKTSLEKNHLTKSLVKKRRRDVLLPSSRNQSDHLGRTIPPFNLHLLFSNALGFFGFLEHRT